MQKQLPFIRIQSLFWIFAFTCSFAMAQEDTLVNLYGRVIDADGKGIPNVSIILKNNFEVSTDSTGAWSMLSTTSSAIENGPKKSPFELDIRGNKVFLKLPKAGLLNVTVFDLSGKSRFRLLNEKIRPGEYKIHLDETKTPHGTWLVKINTPSGSQVLRWSHQGSESTATIQTLSQRSGYKTSILAKASGIPDTLMVQYKGQEIVRMEQANTVAGELPDFIIVSVSPKMSPSNAGKVIETLPLYVLVGQPFSFHVEYVSTSWRPIQLKTGSLITPAAESQQNTTLQAPKDSVIVYFVSPVQKITFSSLSSKALDKGPFSIGAQASSLLPVTVTSNTPEYCSFSGDTAYLVGAGKCQFTTTQQGNSFYNYISVDSSFYITKGTQTITIDDIPDQEFSATPFTIESSINSGLIISYTSQTPFVCTLLDGVITMKSIGLCTFVASQAGNVNYNSTQLTKSFTIKKASQIIYIETIGNKKYLDPQMALNPVANSGLPVVASTTSSACSITSNILTFLSSGNCEITYKQAGNGVYAPAELISTVTILKASQTIDLSVDGLSNIGGVIQTTYNPISTQYVATMLSNRSISSTLYSATSDICSTSGTKITLLKSGECKVFAMNDGNLQYEAASSDTVAFLINKATQIINYSNTADRVYSATPFSITAIANSGLPVVVISNTPSICTIENNAVQLLSTGMCDLSASQQGNEQYLPATNDVSIQISKAEQVIPAGITIANRKLSSGNIVLDYSTDASLPVQFTSTTPTVCEVNISNSSEIILNATGTCTLTASAIGDIRYNDATPVTNISFVVEAD